MRLNSVFGFAKISIRWRLTLLIMILVGAIIVLSSVVAVRSLNSQLRNHFDDSLSEEAQEFVTAVASLQSTGEVRDFVQQYLLLHEHDEQTKIFLFDSVEGGPLALHTLAGGDVFQESLPQPQIGVISVSAIHLTDGEPHRIAAATVIVAGEDVGTIYVAEPTHPVDVIVNEHIRSVAIIAVVGLAIAGVGAYVIARNSLAPVRRITRTAESISREDLSGRIGYEGPHDEVGELATAFDNMIERLDEAFREQHRLLTDLSHEMRTPITVVRGNLDLLRSAPDRSDSEADENIGAAIEELDRMNRLIANLLLLARSSSADFLRQEPVALRQTMQEIITKANRISDRRWVVGHIPECVVLADKDYITSVFLNLFQNAVEHTEPADSVGLDVTLQDGWVSLRVWDSGEGIPVEDLPNVFERFYRAGKPGNRGFQGTGLGLSIVKAVINAHGGTVNVESQPGQGSSFTVRLPVYHASRRRASAR